MFMIETIRNVHAASLTQIKWGLSSFRGRLGRCGNFRSRTSNLLWILDCEAFDVVEYIGSGVGQRQVTATMDALARDHPGSSACRLSIHDSRHGPRARKSSSLYFFALSAVHSIGGYE